MAARESRNVPNMMKFVSADDVVSNAVGVYVDRLRRCLRELGAAVPIHTLRGLGYMTAQSEDGQAE